MATDESREKRIHREIRGAVEHPYGAATGGRVSAPPPAPPSRLPSYPLTRPRSAGPVLLALLGALVLLLGLVFVLGGRNAVVCAS